MLPRPTRATTTTTTGPTATAPTPRPDPARVIPTHVRAIPTPRRGDPRRRMANLNHHMPSGNPPAMPMQSSIQLAIFVPRTRNRPNCTGNLHSTSTRRTQSRGRAIWATPAHRVTSLPTLSPATRSFAHRPPTPLWCAAGPSHLRRARGARPSLQDEPR